MMKSLVVALIVFTVVVPLFGKTHNTTYAVPCNEVWDAVQDAIKNSGNYLLVVADNAQMTAAYNINGAIRSRANSVHLNPQGTNCEMQVQSSYSGLAHDDAGDFKTRVDQSLAKLRAAKPAVPASTQDATK